MIEISLDIMPVSVNAAYRRSAGYGMHMTAAAHAYKEAVHWTAWEQRKIHEKPGLTIIFTFPDKRKHDIDNYLKLLLDAMNGVMWKDDNDIQSLHVYKKYCKGKPNINILIYET